jgi:hypothetical protein
MVAHLRAVLLLILLFTRSVPAIDSPTAEANRPAVPTRIDGVEIEQIHGWFANIYPWKYLPTVSTVFPVRSLWGRPNDYQSPADIAEQNQLLAEYGSGADVLEYSPNPDLPDHNQGCVLTSGTAAVRSSSRTSTSTARVCCRSTAQRI